MMWREAGTCNLLADFFHATLLYMKETTKDHRVSLYIQVVNEHNRFFFKINTLVIKRKQMLFVFFWLLLRLLQFI